MIIWSQSYGVGVKEIDSQHRVFFDIINRLLEALHQFPASNSADCLPQILKELTDYAQYHFKTEESYFKTHNYPAAALHTRQHDAFRRKIAKINKLFLKSDSADRYELVDFLQDWIIKHILTQDKKFGQWYHSHGLTG